MCSPKEYHQKHFRTNGVSASKNTLKTPPQTIFKKGGGSKPPTLSDFLEPPSPGFKCVHCWCLTKVAIYGNVVWYVTHVSKTHGLYGTNQVSKNSTTMTQFKASMMANGRFGQQFSRNKAFNSAPTGVETGKTVFKTPNHCRGFSNTMSSAL